MPTLFDDSRIERHHSRRSVARGIRVIAASGAIRIGTCCCRTQRGSTDRSSTDRSSAIWGPTIPGAPSDIGTMPHPDSADASDSSHTSGVMVSDPSG